MKLVRHLCRGFIERARQLNLKGKKREDAAMDYFVGAAKAMELYPTNEEDYKVLHGWVVLLLSTRGYAVVVQEASRD
jgi:hypothetical protein